MKIFCGRQSMLGDIITNLPFLNFLETLYPGSHKTYSLAKKCANIAPLLLNHPMIDRILISEPEEGIGQNDMRHISFSDLTIAHFSKSTQDDWWNRFNLIEQQFECAVELRNVINFSYKEFYLLPKELRYPFLFQWFNVEKIENAIALLPFAGYHIDTDVTSQKRSPSTTYWKELIEILVKNGYQVMQYGLGKHPLIQHPKLIDRRGGDLLNMITQILGCNLAIGTDSGAMHALGAYGFPQICLYTKWRERHYQNEKAFLPVNNKDKIYSIYDPISVNNISHDKILEGIKALK